MIALGIDPSLGCTGWAVASSPDGEVWVLEDAGTVNADKTEHRHDLWPRVTGACDELEDSLGSHVVLASLDLIAVEMPMEKMFNPQRRNMTTLPGYGVMCGGVAMMVQHWRYGARLKATAELRFPSATEWAIGLPKARKKGDTGKPGRVFAAEVIFGEIAVSRGGVAAKEAIADAALLARWAIMQELRTRRGV